MRQTLFLIPPSWFEGPLLAGWLVVGLLIFAGLVYRYGWTTEAFNFLPVYAVGAALLYFLAPQIGITDIDPDNPTGPEIPVGLAVRGYGLLLLLGIAAGVGLAILRGRREGIDPDKILSLAFWMAVCGIMGARLFFVIQKRDQFSGPPLKMIGEMLNMTQGGLVVYGSLIGASLGGAIYLWRSGLPVLKMADIAAPGMVLGLALGRIGCLMNGCCFGGVCDLPPIAQQFPAGSPPYVRQVETGELLGITSTGEFGDDRLPAKPSPDFHRFAEAVEPGSLADRAGIVAGKWFRVGFPSDKAVEKEIRAVKQRGLDAGQEILVTQGGPWIPVKLADLPARSLGVYPTQLIAAINAALLTALLWFYFPFRRRNGQVFALLIILYSITRFLMELIRRDEYGQFGTGLTISQLVSVLAILGGFALFALAPERGDPPAEGLPADPPAP